MKWGDVSHSGPAENSSYIIGTMGVAAASWAVGSIPPTRRVPAWAFYDLCIFFLFSCGISFHCAKTYLFVDWCFKTSHILIEWPFIYLFLLCICSKQDTFFEQSGINPLIQGPNGEITLKSLGFKSTTFRLEAQCPNLLSYPHTIQCNIPSLVYCRGNHSIYLSRTTVTKSFMDNNPKAIKHQYKAYLYKNTLACWLRESTLLADLLSLGRLFHNLGVVTTKALCPGLKFGPRDNRKPLIKRPEASDYRIWGHKTINLRGFMIAKSLISK